MGDQNRVSWLKCINEFYLSKKYVLLGAMTGGLLAHGYTLTNKFSFHDDIGCTFELGGTLGLGRFTLWEIYIFMTKWVGGIYSMPWFNGVVSLIFLTLAAMLLVDMLTYQGGGGQSKSYFLIGAIMTVFPSVVAIFAFMFTSWPYFLGALLVVCSMWITEKWKYGWAPGILLAVVGLGAYQAWLFLWISIVLLLCMKKCVDSEVALRQLLLYIIKHICLFVIILAGYLVLNKIELARYGVELSSYQGISSVLSLSGLSIDVIFRGSVNSYKNFFFADISGLIEGRLITYLYYSVLVLSLIVMYIILTKIKKLGKKVIFTAIIFVLPLGFNGIWILGELGTLVSSLVCYSLVLVFVAPIIWMDWLDAGNCKESSDRRKRVHYVLCNLLTLLIAIVIAVYVYLDNVAYLEANLKTEQTRSWCIELITKIRGSDDYKDEYPVAFVTDGAIQDMSLTKMTDFKTTFSIYHWDMDLWLSMYTIKPFMKYFCGFNPDIAEEEDYLHLKGVIETMPVYPDDDSIDVIDGIVIVKLQDLE